MKLSHVISLTTLALIAFAGNSVLCRAALTTTNIDAATFTSLRLVSGALTLTLILTLTPHKPSGKGSWLAAIALFVYAISFSLSYQYLSAADGALILFSFVQLTMLGYSIYQGDPIKSSQTLGLIITFTGLIILLFPDLSSPSIQGILLMAISGIAWGIYTLKGKTAGEPIRANASNFMRASLLALLLSSIWHPSINSQLDPSGVLYAIASGALMSGIGYAIWYSVQPALSAITAATIQLSVPAITAFGAVLFLSEPISWHLIISGSIILGGIALVTLSGKRTQSKLP